MERRCKKLEDVCDRASGAADDFVRSGELAGRCIRIGRSDVGHDSSLRHRACQDHHQTLLTPHADTEAVDDMLALRDPCELVDGLRLVERTRIAFWIEIQDLRRHHSFNRRVSSSDEVHVHAAHHGWLHRREVETLHRLAKIGGSRGAEIELLLLIVSLRGMPDDRSRDLLG